MSDQVQLRRAFELLKKGRYDKAKTLCRKLLKAEPADGPTHHLLGLVLKGSGDLAGAERHMRKSVQLAPGIAEYHANLGNLLKRLGRAEEAQQEYRDALALDPASRNARLGLVRALCELGRFREAEAEARKLTTRFPTDAEAWSTLATTLREQERLEEAESCFRKAIAVGPRYAVAHHNLGSMLSLMDRSEEALEALDEASSLGVSGYEIAFNFGRTYMQLYRFDEAEQAFAEAIRHDPHAIDAHVNLARVRFMSGDEDFARDIVAASRAHGNDRKLRILHGIVLRRSGDLEGAETLLRDLLSEQGPSTDIQVGLAQVLHEMGRVEEAEQQILAAATEKPDDPLIVDSLAAILLARGRPEDALPYIRTQRTRSPHGQGWLAYEASAARMLGDESYQRLYDYDRFVRTYDVEPPPGWSSIGELNEALLAALAERHRFPTHPLDQSLRNGSQTARSMLTDPDPAIRAIVQAFEAPVEEYRRSLGTAPGHPISERNTGRAKITGAWSVQLRRDGFHVNHFHPEGWISSAYYISLPPEVSDEDHKSGWIKFGEPRFPMPGATPERIIQPKAGRLVLFPSYMWHGTNPIVGDQPRTTIAFDAIPD